MKIYSWTGICILILALGLAGISCSGEKAAEKAPVLPEHIKNIEIGKEENNKGAALPVQPVIAKVNGSDITMNELVTEMNQIAPSFIKHARQRTPETDKKVKQAALDILVFRELAVQESVKQGMKVSPGEVDEARKQLRKDLGSEESYVKYLRTMGLTEISLTRQLEKEQLFKMITEKEIFQKTKPNDKVAIEARKTEWESWLKKKAKIEIMLAEVEKKIKEESGKQKN